VEQARKALYDNLSGAMIDPHQYVVDRIARSIDKYITHFNLYNSTALLV
jgi:hypothetical protein